MGTVRLMSPEDYEIVPTGVTLYSRVAIHPGDASAAANTAYSPERKIVGTVDFMSPEDYTNMSTHSLVGPSSVSVLKIDDPRSFKPLHLYIDGYEAPIPVLQISAESIHFGDFIPVLKINNPRDFIPTPKLGMEPDPSHYPWSLRGVKTSIPVLNILKDITMQALLQEGASLPTIFDAVDCNKDENTHDSEVFSALLSSDFETWRVGKVYQEFNRRDACRLKIKFSDADGRHMVLQGYTRDFLENLAAYYGDKISGIKSFNGQREENILKFFASIPVDDEGQVRPYSVGEWALRVVSKNPMEFLERLVKYQAKQVASYLGADAIKWEGAITDAHRVQVSGAELIFSGVFASNGVDAITDYHEVQLSGADAHGDGMTYGPAAEE